MKKLLTILIIFLVTSSLFSQVLINNKLYVDKKAFIKLDKMKRLKSVYSYGLNNKNRTELWKKSYTIIYDNYSKVNYNTTVPITIVDIAVLQNYNIIYKRTCLVYKNPSKYKRFWAGWFLGFYKYTLNDVNNIKY